MAGNLRDQLRKQGLATKKQAKAAEHESRLKEQKARQEGKESADAAEAARKAKREQAEKAARDREAARAQEEERRRREIKAQVGDIVRRRRVDYQEGPVAHHFADGKLIMTLHVRDEVHKDIAYGKLGIVSWNGAYHLLPADAVEKVEARMPEAVLVMNTREEEAGGAEDPYAEYKVPDDLMW